jgi:hypothetical protein
MEDERIRTMNGKMLRVAPDKEHDGEFISKADVNDK